MGRALYRTHRPQKLSEVVGQEHITTALERSLKNGTISHAYLFTGTRGTGKTSIARILAHEINGLPYEDDRTHLDIIEIDAASNRRIDEIRDLRDKVHTAPTSAKYKVYIIDEVHMLTKEAFNALLKTLEEPPAHVVFILATTEVHKLPETIISRTQRFSFKPVDLAKVAAHLKELAKLENIDITDDALALIAAHGEGSFRDSISLLDQLRNTGSTVALEDVQATLGIAPKELIEQLLAATSTSDTVTVAKLLKQLQVNGHDAAQVAKQLGQALRAKLLDGKAAMPNDLLLQLLAKLLEVPASSNPRAYLEIALLDAALAGAPQPKLSTASAAPEPKPQPAAEPHAAPAKKTMHEAVQAKPPTRVEPHPSTLHKPAGKPAELEEEEETSTPATGAASDALVSSDAWPQILAATKAKHNTLFSIVRTARPHFEPGKIILECGFAFHQKRLMETRNREVLGEIIKGVTGEDLQIQCIVGQGQDPNNLPKPGLPPLPPEAGETVHTVHAAAPTAPNLQPKPQTEAVSTISNIFGGAEVLES
ncbi:MAG TPA: DNA polymerase III subunit gamma/tau [Patescibacteria group bacterium]|nr:DNA polymerase III subunit gamma/tau [Patescibacteria group bacterium]